MPTYLSTQDVLNVSVSCFANYDTPANPVTINLLTWLKSEKHRPKNEALRKVEDKSERHALKATLPAITPSGVFTYRKESALIAGSHTRLIQFDIDLEENRHILNYADLKAQIANLPFVAYCGLSASGKGYWGLVPIAQPERHEQHVNAMIRVFKSYGIKLDRAPVNVASLRGYSWDAAPYLPEQVMLFELFDTPPPARPAPQFERTANADTERARAEVCISEVAKRGLYIGADYTEWYAIGCSLANGFGESGRTYFHQVSQHYPGYGIGQTDRQFTACLRANSKATLGTFYKLCADAGIEWKQLMPYTPPPTVQPFREPPRSEPMPPPHRRTGPRNEEPVCEAQAPTSDATPCPRKFVLFSVPWAFDATQTLAWVKYLVLPPGVVEGSANDTYAPARYVKTFAEWAANSGSILRPDEAQLTRL